MNEILRKILEVQLLNNRMTNLTLQMAQLETAICKTDLKIELHEHEAQRHEVYYHSPSIDGLYARRQELAEEMTGLALQYSELDNQVKKLLEELDAAI